MSAQAIQAGTRDYSLVFQDIQAVFKKHSLTDSLGVTIWSKSPPGSANSDGTRAYFRGEGVCFACNTPRSYPAHMATHLGKCKNRDRYLAQNMAEALNGPIPSHTPMSTLFGQYPTASSTSYSQNSSQSMNMGVSTAGSRNQIDLSRIPRADLQVAKLCGQLYGYPLQREDYTFIEKTLGPDYFLEEQRKSIGANPQEFYAAAYGPH